MNFGGDTRSVAPVIGFLLIFVILIITFSGYQAFVVPSQNEGVEFDHNQQVQNEMVDVRNAVLDAKIKGERTRAGVSLGTQYPSRIFAMNPPDPSGSIRTTDPETITVYREDGAEEVEFLDEHDQETRFIEYTPTYSEFQSHGTLRYENTVVYHDYGDTVITYSDQEILSGNTVSLIPVLSEFQESSQRRVTVEPIPGLLETESVTNPVVEIPTELSESEWETLLGDELEEGEEITVENGVLTIELSGTYDFEYAPVGINSVPAGGERAPDRSDINPVGEGVIQLTYQELDGTTASLHFTNRGNNATVQEARLNFATVHQGGVSPDYADIYGPGEMESSGRMFSRGDFVDLDPEITIEGDENEDPTTVIDLVWNDISDQSFFVVTFLYDTGDQATYFVGFDTTDPLIQVDIDTAATDDEVFSGETATTVATIFNTGGGGDADIEFSVNDSLQETRTVTLGSGEGQQLEFDYDTSSLDSPEITVEVASEVDSDSETITVVDPDDGPFFSTNIDGTNSPVLQGNQLEVTSTVTNIGTETDTQEVDLTLYKDTPGDLGSGYTHTVTLTLDPDQEDQFGQNWDTTDLDPGEYQVELSSEDTNDIDTVVIEDNDADVVSGVAGTIQTTGGQDRTLGFDVEAEDEVTVTDITVQTDFSYDGRTEEIDGSVVPVTFEGQVGVVLERFDNGLILSDNSFVDPAEADIVVTLTFDDGSTLDLGISANEDV